MTGWLFLGCSNDDSESTIPDLVINGIVTDADGNLLSDVHIHLIYLFETTTAPSILPAAMPRIVSPANSVSPDDEYDLGDFELPYPTHDVIGGGPAHRLSGIAWLGTGVTGESTPHIPGADSLDDGVRMLDLDLEQPCPTVVLRTQVSGGPNYFQQPLYFNMWIDGNEDGDFDDDSMCAGLESSEWWLQNRQVTPAIYVDTLLIPAVNMTMESRHAVRVRLSRAILARTGYVGVDSAGGEVEDHWLGLETQASVELLSFSGEPGNGFCRLHWTTASETGNHYFVVGHSNSAEGPFLQAGIVAGQGTTPTATDYEYIDCGVYNGITYYFRLTAVSNSGVFVDLEPIISLTPSEEYPGPPPSQIYPIYPNPGAEVHIPFLLQCSRQIWAVVESADQETVDTLWNGIPQQPDSAISWNGAHRANGFFAARISTSSDDIGERYFFLNRGESDVLADMEPLYNTGASGIFRIEITRAKWGMSFEGRDENDQPTAVTLSDQVVVAATKPGYVVAFDTVSVSPGAAAQVALVMEPQ